MRLPSSLLLLSLSVWACGGESADTRPDGSVVGPDGETVFALKVKVDDVEPSALRVWRLVAGMWSERQPVMVEEGFAIFHKATADETVLIHLAGASYLQTRSLEVVQSGVVLDSSRGAPDGTTLDLAFTLTQPWADRDELGFSGPFGGRPILRTPAGQPVRVTAGATIVAAEVDWRSGPLDLTGGAFEHLRTLAEGGAIGRTRRVLGRASSTQTVAREDQTAISLAATVVEAPASQTLSWDLSKARERLGSDVQWDNATLDLASDRGAAQLVTRWTQNSIADPMGEVSVPGPTTGVATLVVEGGVTDGGRRFSLHKQAIDSTITLDLLPAALTDVSFTAAGHVEWSSPTGFTPTRYLITLYGSDAGGLAQARAFFASDLPTLDIPPAVLRAHAAGARAFVIVSALGEPTNPLDRGRWHLNGELVFGSASLTEGTIDDLCQGSSAPVVLP